MKKFICRNCGVVNQTSKANLEDDDDWLECVLPQGFEWTLPAGKITPIIGDPIYISGFGEHLSYDAYLKTYGIDPEIAYHLMRGNAGARSASRIFSGPSPIKSQVSSKKRAQNWLDEDDWTS